MANEGVNDDGFSQRGEIAHESSSPWPAQWVLAGLTDLLSPRGDCGHVRLVTLRVDVSHCGKNDAIEWRRCTSVSLFGLVTTMPGPPCSFLDRRLRV
jgi:hypothetical protein